MITRHLNINELTKKRQCYIVIARDVRPPKSPVVFFSSQMSSDLFIKIKFQAIFKLQTAFTTNTISSKHAGNTNL